MSRNKDVIKSNLAKLDAMTDDDIDYSEIPDLGDADMLWDGSLVKKAGEPLFAVIPIDPEILAWFEAQGEECHARINAVLRAYMETKRKADQTGVGLNLINRLPPLYHVMPSFKKLAKLSLAFNLGAQMQLGHQKKPQAKAWGYKSEIIFERQYNWRWDENCGRCAGCPRRDARFSSPRQGRHVWWCNG